MKKLFSILGIMFLVTLFWTPCAIAKPPLAKFASFVAADFADSGLWLYDPVSEDWEKISTDDPDGIVGSGQHLYADFGNAGLWRFDASTEEWFLDDHISTGNVENMASFMDCLIADFGSNGLYLYNPDEDERPCTPSCNDGWRQISTDDAENIFVDEDSSLLYVDFGSDGLWVYDPTEDARPGSPSPTGWSRISTANAEGIAGYYKK